VEFVTNKLIDKSSRKICSILLSLIPALKCNKAVFRFKMWCSFWKLFNSNS